MYGTPFGSLICIAVVLSTLAYGQNPALTPGYIELNRKVFVIADGIDRGHDFSDEVFVAKFETVAKQVLSPAELRMLPILWAAGLADVYTEPKEGTFVKAGVVDHGGEVAVVRRNSECVQAGLNAACIVRHDKTCDDSACKGAGQ